MKNLYEHLRKSCKIVKNPFKQTNLPKNSDESWMAVDELSEQGELVFNNIISDPVSSSEPLKHVDNISRKKKPKTDFSNILSGIEPLSSSEEENTEKSQSHETATKPEKKVDLETEILQEEDLSNILSGISGLPSSSSDANMEKSESPLSVPGSSSASKKNYKMELQMMSGILRDTTGIPESWKPGDELSEAESLKVLSNFQEDIIKTKAKYNSKVDTLYPDEIPEVPDEIPEFLEPFYSKLKESIGNSKEKGETDADDDTVQKLFHERLVNNPMLLGNYKTENTLRQYESYLFKQSNSLTKVAKRNGFSIKQFLWPEAEIKTDILDQWTSSYKQSPATLSVVLSSQLCWLQYLLCDAMGKPSQISVHGLVKASWEEQIKTLANNSKKLIKRYSKNCHHLAQANRNLKNDIVEQRDEKIAKELDNYFSGKAYSSLIRTLLEHKGFQDASEVRRYNIELGLSIVFFNGQRPSVLNEFKRGDLATSSINVKSEGLFYVELGRYSHHKGGKTGEPIFLSVTEDMLQALCSLRKLNADWMNTNKLKFQDNSSTLFINPDGNAIKVATIYTTSAFKNMGFSPELQVRATSFRIIQSTSLYNKSSRTDLPTIVHNHSNPTVEKHYRHDKSLHYQEASALLHAQMPLRVTDSDNSLLEDLKIEFKEQVKTQQLSTTVSNQLGTNMRHAKGVPAIIRTIFIRAIFQMAVPEFSAWMLKKVPTPVNGLGKLNKHGHTIWDRAVLFFILQVPELLDLIMKHLSPSCTSIQDLTKRLRNCIFSWERKHHPIKLFAWQQKRPAMKDDWINQVGYNLKTCFISSLTS